MSDGGMNPFAPRKGKVKGLPPALRHKQRPLRTIDDLYIPVPESGCWIWLGSTDIYGYGYHKGARAHRFFYEKYKGRLSPGYFPCHKCDTPSCVNPDHLFAGTPLDNSRDMCRKGRSATGENWGKSPQSVERRRKIRVRLEQGIEVRQIALEFRVAVALVVREKCRMLAENKAQLVG